MSKRRSNTKNRTDLPDTLVKVGQLWVKKMSSESNEIAFVTDVYESELTGTYVTDVTYVDDDGLCFISIPADSGPWVRGGWKLVSHG